MEDFEKYENSENAERDDIFSTSVRAGKRTYYFDVKSTKKGDFYLTVTERKRRYKEDGSFEVEKHKIFLYQEDFCKFTETLKQTIEFIEHNSSESDINRENFDKKENSTDVDYEDLDI